GSVDLQVEEVLPSRAADRAGVIRYTGEYDCGRTTIHCSGGGDQVVAHSRSCVAEVCCRASVVECEIEEGRVPAECLYSSAALKSDRSSAGGEGTPVGPIAAEATIKCTTSKG